MLRYSNHAAVGAARAGEIRTSRGLVVQTPAFMPVGTQGTVKGVDTGELIASGSRIVLANTYHLLLRPGPEAIARAGGLARWAGYRDLATLTDSGGFQVMSLGHLRTIDEDGVTFRSYLDGATIRLTPERAIAVQEAIGADIIMAFDECSKWPPASREALAESVERTARWLARCAAARSQAGPALFGIVQGGVDLDLRLRSLDLTLGVDLPGYAIGGLAVGEGKAELYQTLARIGPRLPRDRPRYVMGVGTPEDAVLTILAGGDLFDCVLPTRTARFATALTLNGRVNLRQAASREDHGPLDASCPCPACRDYSRAFLAHAFRAREMLAPRLVTVHNLTTMHRVVSRMRQGICDGQAGAVARSLLAGLHPTGLPEWVEVALDLVGGSD